MEFKIIAEYFDRLERITSRLQLNSLLADLLRRTDKNVIDKVVYIIQGKLFPDFINVPELGVGEKFLIKAISIATNRKEKEVEDLLKKIGDLGEVTARLKREEKGSGVLDFFASPQSKPLTVEEVYETLKKVALTTGEGSRDIKIRLISGLLKKANPLEAKFIVRFIEGRLRVGIGDATILEALAIAYGGGSYTREIIERAYNLMADLGYVAKIVAESKGNLEKLKSIKPVVGIPVRPMLAERLQDPHEILSKVNGKALVDYKYDGERAQIHKASDKIFIFSRRLENITNQYPDVVEFVKENIIANEVIVEGEIVAIDPTTGEMRPFQELMHRKRKNDINEAMKEYPVRLYLFDLIYINGEDYTLKPLLERRKKLSEIIKPNENVVVADSIIVDNVKDLIAFFNKAIADGAEGVMVKSIDKDSIYQAGARGWLWIKFKKDYYSEMVDTVDLVVVGGFYGKGKRGGKISSLLMAAYDPITDTFKTVCKVATGFSDAELDELQKKLEEIRIPNKHPRVESKIEPDIWVTPSLVAEILGAEITLSPLHTCCLGILSEDSGLSIRFPRFIRWRDDKKPEDATTTTEILEMYKLKLKKVEEKPETLS
ncbi:MAG: ATP-dependent DNA ligase [Sulfolobaceae archaeon]